MVKYQTLLEKNLYVQVLSEEDRRILFKIFEFVAEKEREEAADLLARQPSLIPILIDNFLRKQEAFQKGGRTATEKTAAGDKKQIQKFFED